MSTIPDAFAVAATRPTCRRPRPRCATSRNFHCSTSGVRSTRINVPHVQIRVASTGSTDERNLLDLVRRELPAFVELELWIGATRRWPVAPPPDGDGSGDVTCQDCGLTTALPVIRMTADEFCSVCDYPLFWVSNRPARGVEEVEPIDRPWLDER
jgi:hypothetical protein